MITIAVVSLGAAIYVLQLHIRIGPARQRITITWAPTVSAFGGRNRTLATATSFCYVIRRDDWTTA
jgi:hypothetical protein